MNEASPAYESQIDYEDDDGPSVGLTELLTWLGRGKRVIALTTALAAAIALAVAMMLPPIYTARATLLPPGAQQQSGSAAALASLGALGGLAGGLGAKTPDELYLGLMKSDTIVRALDAQFKLQDRYEVTSFEALRKVLPGRARVTSDKKSALISIDVDDKDPAFAASLANAYGPQTNLLMSRLAVGEAQQRRKFFEEQVNETKERLIRAEQQLRQVQEKSGVIVLDKQAEALIGGAAQLRETIARREVQLKVLQTGATAQNPEVIRLQSELAALRSELARLESRHGGRAGSSVDLPVGRIPEAAIDFIRARREVKLQETLLEAMLRQFETAKLDEAKEGSQLQLVDVAMPPDHRSKPSRALIVLASILLALIASSAWAITRGYSRMMRDLEPERAQAWQAVSTAWRLRG